MAITQIHSGGVLPLVEAIVTKTCEDHHLAMKKIKNKGQIIAEYKEAMPLIPWARNQRTRYRSGTPTPDWEKAKAVLKAESRYINLVQAEATVQECEHFLKSNYFVRITMMNGELFLEGLRQREAL